MGASSKTDDCIVNVVGVVLKVEQSANMCGWVLYLTDKSHLVLRIQCDDICEKFASFLSSAAVEGEMFKVVEFNDLRTMPFDNDEGYAVAQYCKVSRFYEHPDTHRAQALKQWSASKVGRYDLLKLRVYVNMRLPVVVNSDSRTVKAIGFISGMQVLSSYPRILLMVDCGLSSQQCWKFPLSLISLFALSCVDASEAVVLNAVEERKLTQLVKLGPIYRARKDLFRFSIQRIQGSSFLGKCFEVAHISAVDSNDFAALFSLSELRS